MIRLNGLKDVPSYYGEALKYTSVHDIGETMGLSRLALQTLLAVVNGDDAAMESAADRLAAGCESMEDLGRLSREFAAMGQRLQERLLRAMDDKNDSTSRQL